MKKFFKTFLKMKYNRLSLFIYKKEFRPEHHHSATAYSPQHQRSTTTSTKRQRGQRPQEPKRRGNTKGKRIKKERKTAKI
jgi:hypothetical protein